MSCWIGRTHDHRRCPGPHLWNVALIIIGVTTAFAAVGVAAAHHALAHIAPAIWPDTQPTKENEQ